MRLSYPSLQPLDAQEMTRIARRRCESLGSFQTLKTMVTVWVGSQSKGPTTEASYALCCARDIGEADRASGTAGSPKERDCYDRPNLSNRLRELLNAFEGCIHSEVRQNLQGCQPEMVFSPRRPLLTTCIVQLPRRYVVS